MNPVVRWFHQLGSPPYFDRFAARWAPWAYALGVLVMAYGIWAALFQVPADYQQGDSFRILYIHVPSAWMSLFVFGLMAVYAAIALIWRIKLCEILAMACAPIGAAFTVITLATGSIWGKPMWGTWWDWDPRLTSELILLFLYLGIIGLYNAIDDLVVDHIVSIFGKIFAKHWGPRIDDTMRMACLTLLRKANATLTLIPSLLQDKQFRAAFTSDLDDPEGLLGFWQWFESTPPPLRSQVIGPVLARLRSFLTRPFVTQTVGAARSTVDMRRVLDGGILLARLPKGQIGEETARLMGSFILASAWQTATGRTRIAEDARRDAVAYIDESHNFLNLPGSVGDMLAEARGYRFGLVLAHQNLTQMPRETQLALSANARNKIFFTCAPEDATQLAKHTLPELSDHDLSHLDAYQAAARLVVDGRETPAFTLHTLPPKPPVGETTAVRQAALANVTPPRRDQRPGRDRPARPGQATRTQTPGRSTRRPNTS